MKISKKKIIILVIIVLIILFCVVRFIMNYSTEDDDKIVTITSHTEKMSTQTILTTLTASGEVQAANSEKLTLNTSYYFSTMCVEKGDSIKAGTNILKYTNGTYLKAPYDCVIEEYSVPTVSSICTSSNYVSISSTDKLYMDISISEEQINKISVGQSVEIVVNYDESKTYTGTITKINAIGTYGNGGTSFAAIASLDNDESLKIGMSAVCTVTVETKECETCLPIEAINADGTRKYVNVVQADGSTKEVDVETGVSNANYVEIVSGLTSSDEVYYETTTIEVVESEDDSSDSENALSSLFNFGGGDKSSQHGNRGGF